MNPDRRIRFGTNLITFFDPGWWGLDPHTITQGFRAEVRRDPRRYFDRMLDGVREAGLEGVELAPEPADWQAAIAAYGSAQGLRRALDERGLTLTSSYAYGTAIIGDSIRDPSLVPAADELFARHAQFISDAGASIIVTGNLPRVVFSDSDPDANETLDFDAPVALGRHEVFADHLNRVGAVIGRYGVSLAIHTDAYSICSRNEDISTLLSLTDPTTVALCPDAGHITLDGGDAVAVLRDHIERIPTMHWKDCTGHLDGRHLRGDTFARHDTMLKNFRILGSGVVDWTSWMHVLREHQWQGWATEENDMASDPIAELSQGRRFFDTELAGIYR